METETTILEKRYNWTEATKNPFKALKDLYGCINSNHSAHIERIDNIELSKQDFPLMDGNNTMPYRERKPIDTKVYVVVFYSKKLRKLPFWVKLINIITYPIRFIPKQSILRMKEYTCYTYRIGDVTHGYSVEFHIPKKFKL